MCRESLLQYLITEVKDIDEKDLRTFVETQNLSEKIDSEKKNALIKALEEVKICDPAVGSGAFPMGLLNLLFACRHSLAGEEKASRAEIKMHIVQNSIYGVDIEKGAVDIARLRFWLSIVVDAEKPEPLPNLDYKIMQGNSLLESYEGIDLSHLLTHETTELFDADTDKIQSLQKAISKYYLPEDHKAKEKIEKQIKETVLSILTDRYPDPKIIKDLKSLDLKANTNFFLWHTWFSDVFSRPSKQGFDIVIGNPPYGANIDSFTKIFKKIYPNTSHGFKDIYKYFYDQSLRLLNKNGIITFITPSTFLRQPRYRDLRKVMLKNRIYQLLDLGEEIFDAVVPVAIAVLQKTTEKGFVKIVDLTKVLNRTNATKVLSTINFHVVEQNEYANTQNNIFIENIVKLADNVKILNDILFFKDAGINYQRVNVGLHEKGKSDLSSRMLYDGVREKSSDVEYWKGSDIDSFYIQEHTGRYCRPDIKIREGEHITLNIDYFALKPKLLWRQTAQYPIAAIDDEGHWFGRSIQAGTIRPEFQDIISYEYLCGLLNSKYLRYLYEQNVKETGRVFPQVKLEKLKPLPIIVPTLMQINEISELVKRIIALKRKETSNNTKEYESQIDQLVYKLYSLTDEEIKIVEGK